MNKNEIQEIIKDCNINKTHFLFKKMFINTPSWENIFEHMSYEYFRPNINFPDSWKIYGGIASQRNPFYFQIRDAIFYKEYKEVMNFFDDIMNNKTTGGGVFVDLIANNGKVDFHSDPANQFHWQIKGKSTWQFKKMHNDDKEQVDATIEVDEGDVVYLPDGIYHSVVSKSARAGTTFVYQLRKGIVSNG